MVKKHEKSIKSSQNDIKTSFTTEDNISPAAFKMSSTPEKDLIAAPTHSHTYHLVREYRDFENSKVYSKFACLCGAVKRVQQFEEENQ